MARDAGTEDAQGTGRRGYFARNQFFFSLLLPAFLLGTGRGFTVPVLPVIARDEFNASVAGASLLILAPLFGALVSTLPTGYIIDRFGRRGTLIGGSPSGLPAGLSGMSVKATSAPRARYRSKFPSGRRWLSRSQPTIKP